MTEYEMFMKMINRIFVLYKNNNFYWFSYGEEIKGNMKVVFIEDNENCFDFEFDEKGKLVNIY